MRFQDAVLLVSYWIPAFVAVIVVDWLIRTRGRTTINPAYESTDRLLRTTTGHRTPMGR